ncbi:MAG TPA: hypothetical protein VFQ71_10185, partial [Gaiellales bacterium]|nr:hypothetical protein [Gaiellales bacterium]
WRSVSQEDVSAGGAADAQSGIDFYEFRISTDGGSNWSAWAQGSDVPVADEGSTLVQFEAVNGVGLVSPVSQAEVDIDRTAPSVPAVTGGSSAWQTQASVNISASGSTDNLSGVTYQYETSTDGGSSWSQPVQSASAQIGAEGTTEVQFRAVDGAGNASAWSTVDDQSTVVLDHTPPSVPSVGGGSWTWLNAPSETISASGSSDALSGLGGYQYETSTDGGSTWSQPVDGDSAQISDEGQTLVQFRAVDVAGNASAWSAVGPASTVMLDRTAPGVPTVTGGSASWQNIAAVTVSASGSTDNVSGVTYQYETSTDGGSTWSQPLDGASAPVTAEGTTEVQFRAVDGAGNASAWSPVDDQSTVMLDRSAPSVPAVSGGDGSWKTTASETVSASGSIDPAGGSGFAGYQYETSTDGGSTWSAPAAGSSLLVSSEGQTLVQFRALDNAGNASAWSAVGPASTVKLDRTAPLVGATGGSSSWLTSAPVTVTVSASDAVSGVNAASYKYRTSTNNGGTWSTGVGGSVQISASGTTVVQFQVTDQAGNVSAWGPAVGTPGATVKLDTTKPTAPTLVSGGSTSWSTAASKAITVSGGSDAGSGLAGYQYETSFNNGAWSAAAAVTGNSVTFSAEGTTKVQFRTIDNAGNFSSWTVAGNSATVRLDRTAPSLPTVTGGSTTCTRGTIVIHASSTDNASGVAGYRYRMSTNGGTTWSSSVNGSSVRFRSKGTWIVQFQAWDAAGNTTAWAPATAGPANTACHS